MKLLLSPTAAKSLVELPRRDAEALREKLVLFADDPFAPHGWAKAFGGGMARVRHGDWRAVCQIRQKDGVLAVLEIAHRREIYR
jgi:mRNA interferase RelE/StbE